MLAAPPLALSMMATGFVFFVFLPSMVTTPLAGACGQPDRRQPCSAAVAARRAGGAGSCSSCLRLEAFILGLVLVGDRHLLRSGGGDRLCQPHRGAATAPPRAGSISPFYYGGGLAGAALVGQLFDRLGWNAAVAGIFAALAFAAWLGRGLSEEEPT